MDAQRRGKRTVYHEPPTTSFGYPDHYVHVGPSATRWTFWLTA